MPGKRLNKRTNKPKTTYHQYFSYALKRKIVNDILMGITTKQEAKIKHDIRSNSTINNWIRKFAHLNYEPNSKYPMKQTPKEKINELEAQIKELEDAKYVLNLVIDYADETFKTDIRKKLLPQSLKRFKKDRKK